MPRRKRRWVEAERAAQAAATAPKSAPTQPTQQWPQYMTYPTIARYLGVTRWVAYRWIRRFADEGKLLVNQKTMKADTVCKDDIDRLWREEAETAA